MEATVDAVDIDVAGEPGSEVSIIMRDGLRLNESVFEEVRAASGEVFAELLLGREVRWSMSLISARC